MRINRICSEPEDREIRFSELKEMLLARFYPHGVLEAAVVKARSIPRDQALKQVSRRKTNTRPVFVVSWDPRLPSISDLTKKHWRVMLGQDPYLGEVFPDPPLVAYKRQRNIRDNLIKSSIPNLNTKEHRITPGMKKCGKCGLLPICFRRQTSYYKNSKLEYFKII